MLKPYCSNFRIITAIYFFLCPYLFDFYGVNNMTLQTVTLLIFVAINFHVLPMESYFAMIKFRVSIAH